MASNTPVTDISHDDLIDINAAAELLGRGTNAAYGLLRSRNLRRFKIGNTNKRARVRWLGTEVQELADAMNDTTIYEVSDAE